MAKIITKNELQEIVNKLFVDESGEYLSESTQVEEFLRNITEAVCSVCGGEVGNVDTVDDGDGLGMTIAIRPNDCLPSDGGIWKEYDTDVTWTDGVEDKV